MKPRYFISRDERAYRLIMITMKDGYNPEVYEYRSESTIYLGGKIGRRTDKASWELFKGHTRAEDMKEIDEKQLQFYQAIGTWPDRTLSPPNGTGHVMVPGTCRTITLPCPSQPQGRIMRPTRKK